MLDFLSATPCLRCQIEKLFLLREKLSPGILVRPSIPQLKG